MAAAVNIKVYINSAWKESTKLPKVNGEPLIWGDNAFASYEDASAYWSGKEYDSLSLITYTGKTGTAAAPQSIAGFPEAVNWSTADTDFLVTDKETVKSDYKSASISRTNSLSAKGTGFFSGVQPGNTITNYKDLTLTGNTGVATVLGGTGKESLSDAVTQDKTSITYKTVLSRTATAVGTLKLESDLTVGPAAVYESIGNTITKNSKITTLPVESGYTYTAAQVRVDALANDVESRYSGNRGYENVVTSGGEIVGSVSGGTESVSVSNTEKHQLFDQEMDEAERLVFTRKVGDSAQQVFLDAATLEADYTRMVKGGVVYYVSKTDAEIILTPVYVDVVNNRSYSYSYSLTGKGKFTGSASRVDGGWVAGYKTVVLNDTEVNGVEGSNSSFKETKKLSTVTKNTGSGETAYTSQTVTSSTSSNIKNTAAGSLTMEGSAAIIGDGIDGMQTVSLNGGGLVFDAGLNAYTISDTSASTSTELYAGSSGVMRQDYLNNSAAYGEEILHKVLKTSDSTASIFSAAGTLNVNQGKGSQSETATNFGGHYITGYKTLKISNASNLQVNAGDSATTYLDLYSATSQTKTGRDMVSSSTKDTQTVSGAGSAILNNVASASALGGYQNVTLIDTDVTSVTNISNILKNDVMNVWESIRETDGLADSYNSSSGMYDLSLDIPETFAENAADSFLTSAKITTNNKTVADGTLRTSGAVDITDRINHYTSVYLGSGAKIISGTIDARASTNSSFTDYSRKVKAGVSSAAIITEKISNSNTYIAGLGSAVVLDGGVQLNGAIQGYQNVTLGSGAIVSSKIERTAFKEGSSFVGTRVTSFGSGTLVSGLISDSAAPIEITETGTETSTTSSINGGTLKTAKNASGVQILGAISGYQTVSLENTTMAGGIQLNSSNTSSSFKYERVSAGLDGAVTYNSAAAKSTYKDQAVGTLTLNQVTFNDTNEISGYSKAVLNGVNMTGDILANNFAKEVTDTFVRMKKNEEINLRTVKTVEKYSAAGSLTLTAGSESTLAVNGRISGYKTVKLTGAVVNGDIFTTNAEGHGDQTDTFTFTGSASGSGETAACGTALPLTTDFIQFYFSAYPDLSAFGKWTLTASSVKKNTGSITLVETSVGQTISGFQTVSLSDSSYSSRIDLYSITQSGTISGSGSDSDSLTASLVREKIASGSVTGVKSTFGFIEGAQTVVLDESKVVDKIIAGKNIMTATSIESNVIIWKTVSMTAFGTLTLKDSTVQGDIASFQTINVKSDSTAGSVSCGNTLGEVKTSLVLAKGASLNLTGSLEGEVGITVGENASLKVNSLGSEDSGLIGTAIDDKISIGKNAELLVFGSFSLDDGVNSLALTNAVTGSATGSVFATDAAFESWGLGKITGKGTVVCKSADVESVKEIAAAGVNVVGSDIFSATTAAATSCDKPLTDTGSEIFEWIGAGNLTDYYNIKENHGITFSSASGLDGVQMEISFDNGVSWAAYENASVVEATGCVRIGFDDGKLLASLDYSATYYLAS